MAETLRLMRNGTGRDGVRGSAPAPRGPDGRGIDEAQSTEATRLFSVSRWLRFLGGALVVAGTSTFFYQHWEQGSEVTRYLSLLALTVVLGGTGFLCGLGVREARGARLLLGLVLAAVPVHFAVLGGLLQSRFPWDGVISASAPWNAATPGTALRLAVLGLAVLAPLCWVALRTLVRPHAGRLTLVLLAVHLPLLAPLRDPAWVAWMVAAMTAVALGLDRRLASFGVALRTPEGVFVRALMALPVIVLGARTLVWYQPTELFVGMLLVAGGLAPFCITARLRLPAALAHTVQTASACAAVYGWTLVAGEMLRVARVADELELLVTALPAAALLAFLATRAVGTGTLYRVTAVAIAVGAAMLNSVLYWEAEHLTVAGFACLLVGVVTATVGVYRERRTAALAGLLATLLGLAQAMSAAVALADLGNWVSLAAMGIALIFVAAACERHARRLAAFAGAWRARIRTWEY